MATTTTDREPQIIAIAHQKGGTGKTTTVCNLAACFAARDNGLRVIVIDLDPQAASSSQLADGELAAAGAYDVIVAGQVPRDAVQTTTIKNCLLIPATDRLVMSEMDAATRNIDFDAVSRRLRDNLKGADLILLDCPAGFGTIATMAMAIADLVVVPTPPLLFESRALAQTIDHAERLRRQARSRLAVVLTMIDPANAAQADMAQRIREEWRSVLVPVEVPRDPAMDAAILAGRLIVDFDPAAPAAEAYRRLAADLGRRVGFDLPEAAPAPTPAPEPMPPPPPTPRPIDHAPVPELFRQPPPAPTPAPVQTQAPVQTPAPTLMPTPAPTLAPAPPPTEAPAVATPSVPAPSRPSVPAMPAEAIGAAEAIVPSAPPASDESMPAPAPAEPAAVTPDDNRPRPGLMAWLWRLILVLALVAVAGVATFLVLIDIGFLPWVLGAAVLLLVLIFPALLFRLF